MDVLVRVDASPRLGTGHAIRCLTLAAEFDRRGHEVTFASRTLPAAVEARIAAAGHPIVTLPGEVDPASTRPWDGAVQRADAEALRLQADGRFDVAVVDHYGLDHRWEADARTFASRLVAIDDLADREHDVDVLVDQTWAGPVTTTRYDGLVPSNARRLLGPAFALLQAEYARERDRRSAPSTPPRRVVASFGGSDPTRETPKFLEAVASLDHAALRIDLVVGGSVDGAADLADRARRSNLVVHHDLPSLAPLLASADLAVGAGGVTSFERLCLGVPALVVTTADNQHTSTRALDRAGALRLLGDARTSDASTYARGLAAALRGELPPPPPMVDGLGASRVVAALEDSTAERPSVRRARAADVPTFLCAAPDGGAWRPDSWPEHLARWREATQAVVVELGGCPVGAGVRDARGDVTCGVLAGILSGVAERKAEAAMRDALAT